MKRWKKILSLILCFILCFMVITPHEAEAGVGQTVLSVVEKGFSYLIYGVATAIVVIVINPLDLSIKGMISQGSLKDSTSQGSAAYDLTTIAVDENSDRITGLFDQVIKQWYPPLILIAIIVFMLGLIYIGIQAVFSTASSKRAEYMERLKGWAFGLILLFSFNFIMVGVIKINNGLASFFLEQSLKKSGVSLNTSQTSTNATSENSNNSSNQSQAGGSGNEFSQILLKETVKAINALRIDNPDGKKNKYEKVFEIKTPKGNVIKVTCQELIASAYGDANYTEWKKAHSQPKFFLDLKTGKLWRLEGNTGGKPYKDGSQFTGDINEIDNNGIYGTRRYFLYINQIENENIGDVYIRAKSAIGEKIEENGEIKYKENTRPFDVSDIYGINVHSEGAGLGLEDGWHTIAGDTGQVDETNIDLTKKEGDSLVAPKDEFLKRFYDEYHQNEEGKIGNAILYLGAVAQTLLLFIIYFVRVFIVSFLILIFPAVMAIYCIDRLDDNKSAVFGEWWKQFTANVFTNSIHALTYAMICSVVLSRDYSNFVQFLALCFLFPANNLARQVFGISRGGMADLAGIGALAGMVMIGQQMAGAMGRKSSGAPSGGGGSFGGSGGGQEDKLTIPPAKRLTVAGIGTKALTAGKKVLGAGLRTGVKMSGAVAGGTIVAATGGGIRDAAGAGFVGWKIAGGMLDYGEDGVVGVYKTGKYVHESIKNRKTGKRLSQWKNHKVEANMTANGISFRVKNANDQVVDEFDHKGNYFGINPYSDKPMKFSFEIGASGEIKDNEVVADRKSIDELIKSDLRNEDNTIFSLQKEIFNSYGIDLTGRDLTLDSDYKYVVNQIRSRHANNSSIDINEAISKLNILRARQEDRQAKFINLQEKYVKASKVGAAVLKQDLIPRDIRPRIDRTRNWLPNIRVDDV